MRTIPSRFVQSHIANMSDTDDETVTLDVEEISAVAHWLRLGLLDARRAITELEAAQVTEHSIISRPDLIAENIKRSSALAEKVLDVLESASVVIVAAPTADND